MMRLLLLFLLLTPLCSHSQSTPLPALGERIIHYCVDPHWAPYESIQDGQHVGISKLYLDLIAQYSNLTVQLYPTKTWAESLQALADRDCDFIPMLNESEERKKHIIFSQEYFRSSNVLYGHNDSNLLAGFSSLSTETVAVVKDYRLHHYLRIHYPRLTIHPVATELDGLNALSQGEADLFVGSFYSANLLVHDLGLTDIRILGIAELEDHLKVGVNKDAQYLLPYINQAIAQFTDADHQQVFSHLQRPGQASKVDYSLAWKVGGLAISVVLILMIKHYESLKQQHILSEKNNVLVKLKARLEHKNKQLAEVSIRDHLTNLYNRMYLNSQIDANIRLKSRYDTPCCLIIIDVDDFKLFNDKYGHKIGDDVLINVAKALTSVCRETDVVARWGGEEFAVLCPETHINDAKLLAARFQHTLAELKQDELDSITCSIGIAELSKDDNEYQWFTHADNAMYEAKAKGKNSIHISSASATNS